MLMPVMSETSKTAKIILVLYWGLGYNRSAQYSTKMIFAVLDISLNFGETDKVFFSLIINFGQNRLVNYEEAYKYPALFVSCLFNRPNSAILLHC